MIYPFQSTHPQGSATHKLDSILAILGVSIHAPASATSMSKNSVPRVSVSIHAPARVRLQPCCLSGERRMSFNPRTRKGCDGGEEDTEQTDEVSIHALQSATSAWWHQGFQCAPARCIACLVAYLQQVSIHAPARVRQDIFTILCKSDLFQSTHPQSATYLRFPVSALSSFQSTHPQGVRLIGLSILSVPPCSTTHPQVRPKRLDRIDDFIEFQSTHPQGATSAEGEGGCGGLVSIHAPARGATRHDHRPERLEQFQSTHPQGATTAAMREWTRVHPFQSTHPQGATSCR